MIVPIMAISNLVLTQQIYSEETNGAHAHYREPVPLKYNLISSQGDIASKYDMHGGLCNFVPTGINGVLALKDEAYKRGWLVVAHEHFEPIADPFKLKISKQLKWIRQTGTRIVVLNCYKKYSRQVRMIYNTRGSQSTNLELTVLFVCFCFCCCCCFFFQ